MVNQAQCRPPLDDTEVDSVVTHALTQRDSASFNGSAPAPEPVVAPVVTACTLVDVHRVFRRWLGDEYDLDALDAVLATAAAERLTATRCGCWSSPARATPRPRPCKRSPAPARSSPARSPREGALLSGDARKRERAKDATGGLLRKIGDRGLLVIKDVTSILSMNRDTRASRARRAPRDPRRPLGAQRRHRRRPDPDLDRPHRHHRRRHHRLGPAHAVIATHGRPVRRCSAWTRPRAGMPAGRRAIGNTGDEAEMRAELAAAVGGVLGDRRPDRRHHAHRRRDRTAARRRRPGHARPHRRRLRLPRRRHRRPRTRRCRPGSPSSSPRWSAAPSPSASTATAALRLALRCARDSMPPLRLAILDDVAAHPRSQTRRCPAAARQAARHRRPAAAVAAHARRADLRRRGSRAPRPSCHALAVSPRARHRSQCFRSGFSARKVTTYGFRNRREESKRDRVYTY